MSVDEELMVANMLAAFYTPAEVDQWMLSPHPQLEGRCAVDCPYHEVKAVIERLESCAYL